MTGEGGGGGGVRVEDLLEVNLSERRGRAGERDAVKHKTNSHAFDGEEQAGGVKWVVVRDAFGAL